MSLRAMLKGWVGETFASLAHTLLLDKETYRDLNNVTIATADGTTQIDHVIVSRYGIFVIEAKNMNGWIFGNENAPQWTQSFPNGKFTFQNPLRQNYRHTKCLAEFLGIEHQKIHSVVMFWGDSTFKTAMPENVLDRGYSSYIKSKREVFFSDDEVEKLVDAIQYGRLPRTWATHKEHVSSLNARHAKPNINMGGEKSSTPVCPICGNSMLKRLAKNGTNAGKEFWGCAHFPSCRGIVNL